MTMPLVMAFGYSWQSALFVGVTMAATSVSISAQVLIEIGVLRTKEGNALLATALIDDVVAILLVSLTIAITGPQEAEAAAAGRHLCSLWCVCLAISLPLRQSPGSASRGSSTGSICGLNPVSRMPTLPSPLSSC